MQAFEKSLELDKDFAECHFYLALAYDKSKRPDAARKTFEHAKAAIRVRSEYKKRFQEVLKNSEVANKIAKIVSEIPLGLIPPDEDCANAVVFFASDLSAVVTGQALDVNGGEYFH